MGARTAPFAVKLEGVRELTRAIAAIDPALIKGIQERNRAIGQRIINAAMPKPLNVGSGAGAVPRPSGSRNVLRIMAGGSWRHHPPVQPWGRIQRPKRDIPRPYIWQAAAREIPRAQEDYLNALFEAAARAGLQARRF
jgi:hypothetical protein